ncbi:MAG TPA: glycoside hydrolase family 57 protein [Phycisphaerae bacterium]|nr:glycoside hydrolase family 57 protein [Phycisphaerae bacterium]
MASVCFYFQLHQPCRLRRYSVFDTGCDYFDTPRNAEICKRIASRCYLPANKLMLRLIRRHQGRFRIAYGMTGVLADQLQQHAPQVLDSFRELNETGCVEFVTETYHHSLSFLYSRREFEEQIRLHQARMEKLFGCRPAVFRNTEMIYNNDLAHFVAGLGFRGVLTEGADHLLRGRSPNYLYRAPGAPGLTVLLRNHNLSDDIAFRIADRQWAEYPLTPEKFAGWVNQVNGNGYTVNLFADYETVGEHQWADSGIFDFLEAVPGEVLIHRDNDFKTPSEVIASYPAGEEYDVPHMISWADTERDLSAWLGNAMQSNALHELYRLEADVKACGDPRVLDDWRLLQTSDHFYYMCTKHWADGAVHDYFNPYESPYDSYINFMNVLDHLRRRVVVPPQRQRATAVQPARATGPRCS